MTISDYIIDTRFEFTEDNPFEDDVSNIKKRKLKNYLLANGKNFIDVDPYNSSPFVRKYYSKIDSLFGKELKSDDISSPHPLIMKTNEILAKLETTSAELKKSIIPIVATGAAAGVVATSAAAGGVNSAINSSVSTNDSTSDSTQNMAPLSSQLEPVNIQKFINEQPVYDIYSQHLVTFEELRKMSIQIARRLRDPNSFKDETLIEYEKERRRKLINEIKDFKNVTEIAPYIEDELGNLSIEQLENIREKCEKLHAHNKVNEALNFGFDVGGVVYDTMFPTGIPLSGKRRMKFDGMGTELKGLLMDNTKTTGFSFSRYLQKHDIKISDESTILMAFVRAVVSNVKIVNNETPKKKISRPKIKLNAESEANDYEEENESDSNFSYSKLKSVD